MKRFLTIMAMVLAVLLAGGCSSSGGFKVTSCSVASITPSGLRAMNAVLKVGISNPMMALTISSIEGVINNEGQEFATFSSGKLSVARRSEKVYPLVCQGAISKDVGLMDLMRLASSQDFSGMTVNLAIKVRLKCGLGKTFRFKDIKITDLLESDVAAAYLERVIAEGMSEL